MTQPESRAEHHAHTPPEGVRKSRRRVRGALTQHAIGRENAIHASDLTEHVDVAETTVRDIIAELRDDPEGPPVGHCGDGYYIIQDQDELEAWVGGVREEIATKRERLEANIEAYNRYWTVSNDE